MADMTQDGSATSLDLRDAAPEAVRETRGRLRVYLGATPGSGKTFAMLREAHDRRGQGEDVVVGYVETHGRRNTEMAIGNLEVIPRLRVEYQGRILEEMDLDAVLTRHPQVVLVDELAHTNAPGVRHPKRYQDVEDILDAGIDVITTVNVQHLESVKDLVEHITGITVRETLPDRVLDHADEVHFIDISPEALRKRMRHGNVYAADKVDTALSNFFRPGNLAALREIALRMVAQTVGKARGGVRTAPEDVLVAVSGRPSSGGLIRRAARLARRFDGFCTVLCIREDSTAESAQGRDHARQVADLLQCAYVERTGKTADVVLQTARELGVQHVVIGESQRPGVRGRLGRGLVDRLITELPDVDIHVIARFQGSRGDTGQAVAERPDSDALLRALHASVSRAGLRVYLGYARGSGTTIAMLEEARRRKARGSDLVVAAVSTRQRAACEGALDDLEVLGGRRSPAMRGHVDVEALLRRNPEVACIDDLAALDTDGHPIADTIPRLLRAGMTVIATLHLTDLRSTVEGMGELLGTPPEHILDDSVLDLATELEIVDVTPSVLDERLRRGEILPVSQAARARTEAFRPEVLAALRELAFRVIAEHTDRRLVAYMRDRGIETPWEAKPRVMLCVPPRSGMEDLLVKVEHMAERLDGRFTAVTVRDHRRSEEERQLLGRYAALAHQAGGEFVTLNDRNPAHALAAYARRTLATHVIVTRGRGRRGTLRQLIRILTDVDIHILTTPTSRAA
jgi:two-component system, OmpR family, sensor histidine kinase KdpD